MLTELVTVGLAMIQLHPASDLLAREDKWFLEGTHAVIWAPPHTLWTDRPGFWDHACVLDVSVEPIFTVTLVDDSAREIPFRFLRRWWRPGVLTQNYGTNKDIAVTEFRYIGEPDTLTSELHFRNTGKESISLFVIAWTGRKAGQRKSGQWFIDEIDRVEPGIRFSNVHLGEDLQPQEGYTIGLYCDRRPIRRSLNISQGGPLHPKWEYTPFKEKMTPSGLPEEWKERGGASDTREGGTLFGAVSCSITVPPGGEERVTFMAPIRIVERKRQPLPNTASLTPSSPEAIDQRWEEFFSAVPQFKCSDPYIEKYYWYRWYGLRLNTVRLNRDPLPYPCVFEGINKGWFRHHISYSAQVHMLDLKWMHDPSLAQGSLLNFIHHQREDGGFHGGIRNFLDHGMGGFYHGSWGKGVYELSLIHPDRWFLSKVYEPLVRYAEYFQRERDKEDSHLYDVINQGETGQEYMSRYLFVDEKADQWGRIQLKGVDATVYICELYEALAWMSEQLGQPKEETRQWEEHTRKTLKAIRERMWDPELEMFVDVHPETMKRSPYKAALGFYPFRTDIAEKRHLAAIEKHLLNPREFRTNYPLPSTSMDDPYYSPDGEWKNSRHSCPWNGRSWLMTSSHACDCLAEASKRLDRDLRPRAAEMLHNFIRMMFLDGDLNRPSSYEYYNPINGTAPIWRGTEDYMHSYVIDLIIKHVAGLNVGEDHLTIDALPMGLEFFDLEDVQIRGHRVDVHGRTEQDGSLEPGITVFTDGEVSGHTDWDKPLKVRF